MMKKLSLLILTVAGASAFGQRIGINTPPTNAQLSILSGFGEVLRIEGPKPYISFYDGTPSTYRGFLWHDVTGLKLASVTNEPLFITANYGNSLTIAPNGYMGIANENPVYPLDVSGRVRLRNTGTPAAVLFTDNNSIIAARAGMISDNIFGWYNSSGNAWNLQMDASTGNAAIGSSPSDAKLKVEGSGIIAMELEGGIGVFGNTPAAFEIIANSTTKAEPDLSGNFRSLIIDQPACNNDPSALIFIMPQKFFYQELILARYDALIAKWKIIINPAAQCRIPAVDNYNLLWRACSLPCMQVGPVIINPEPVFGFRDFDSFNVLVIKK